MTTLPASIFPQTDFASAVYRDLVGFSGVLFQARSVDGWSDWTSEPFLVTRHVPGGNLNITQDLGRGPERCRYSIGLASGEDFAALKALVGTESTLTLPADVAAIDATLFFQFDRVYQQMTNVLLALIDTGSIQRRRGGIVLCEVEFQRDGPT